jgi:hypothetical protein
MIEIPRPSEDPEDPYNTFPNMTSPCFIANQTGDLKLHDKCENPWLCECICHV